MMSVVELGIRGASSGRPDRLIRPPGNSERLRYRPVDLGTLDAFHGLVQDEHVRRSMIDGLLFPHECSEERVRESLALRDEPTVCICLAHDQDTDEPVAFHCFRFPTAVADD